MEELLLTDRDNQNFVALVNAIYDIKVRSGKRSTNHTLRGGRKLSILSKQNFECYSCSKEFISTNGRYSSATTEHVIPYRYGSSCNNHNVVLLCDNCNRKRNIQNNHTKIIDIIEEHFGAIDYSMIPDKPIPRIRVKFNDGLHD